jgi:predicted permease
MLKRVRSLWRVLSRRRNFETDMGDELRFHIEQYTQDLVRSGLSPKDANRRARIEFGGMNSVEAECRESRGLRLFDELERELRYAARLLWKTPAFTATALLTLALCLGANLTVFAVLDSVLLRALPFPQASQLVTLFNTYPKAGVDRDGSSLTNYYERRGHIAAFSSLSIYRYGTAIVGEAGSTRQQHIMAVSPEFFSTLGLGPVIGRSFTEQETTFQTNDVVILSDAYWRQHFQADRGVIGRHIRVDGSPKTVIGVLPAKFHFLSSEAQLYFPLASRPEDRGPLQRHSGGNVTQMIARLRPGVSIAQAQSEIDAQNAALEVDDPQGKAMADAGFRSLVASLHGDHVATIRPTLLLLQAGVLLLLLIGAVNLANLLLVRAGTRVKELAVRQALGATRRHVISEVLMETTLLTISGALLGMAAGAAGIRLLLWLGADRLPLAAHIDFNSHVALAGAAAAILLGIALAAPIAWFNLRTSLNGALNSEARGGTAGHAAQRLRHTFIVAQIALAFVLLSGAGLLGLSLKRAMAVAPGFDPDHVLSAEISLVGNKYPSATVGLAFTERLVSEVERQPGVLSAGMVTNIPFSGNSGKSAASVKGRVVRPGESPRANYSYGVAGDYLKAMGFSLRAGRLLTAADSRRRERVCVVDEDFARYYWPHESALGHRLWQGSATGSDADAFTVVGVIGRAKQAGLTDDTAQGAVYYPYIYRSAPNLFVVARASMSAGSLGLALRRVVRQIDPELAVNDMRPMEARIADSLVARRSPALLAGLFSGIALLLTAIGTYGVLSYAVAQRRREIAVRMALGASPGQIRSHFLLLVLRLLAGGTVLGAVGAWLTGQAMRAVLFHVGALDSTMLVATAVIVAAVSIGACLLPARRAARIAPMQALAEN